MVGHKRFLVIVAAACMMAVSGVVSSHPSSGTTEVFSCDVLAPFQTECSTGAHTYAVAIGLGFADAGGYVGRGSNVVTWSGGSATMSCLFAGALLFLTCTAAGTPPPPGETFEHVCVSEPVMNVPPTGTLRCVISHD